MMERLKGVLKELIKWIESLALFIVMVLTSYIVSLITISAYHHLFPIIFGENFTNAQMKSGASIILHIFTVFSLVMYHYHFLKGKFLKNFINCLLSQTGWMLLTFSFYSWPSKHTENEYVFWGQLAILFCLNAVIFIAIENFPKMAFSKIRGALAS